MRARSHHYTFEHGAARCARRPRVKRRALRGLAPTPVGLRTTAIEDLWRRSTAHRNHQVAGRSTAHRTPHPEASHRVAARRASAQVLPVAAALIHGRPGRVSRRALRADQPRCAGSPLNEEMDLTGTRRAERPAAAGADAAEKEELRLCGGQVVARRSFPKR